MALDPDDEILQDFLIEAGEILESLSEQLVELESRPDDADLLNAIFRGFHTVKGGAGFLALDNLVEVCHIAENVFDILRQGERQVDADLMDVMLQALDTVNAMFEQIRSFEDPDAAEPELLKSLNALVSGDSGSETVEDSVAVEEQAPVEPEEKADAAQKEKPAGDEITEDEFDQLLDELHGSGVPGVKSEGSETKVEDKKDEGSSIKKAAAGGEITEEEFEGLLDELYGGGKGPTLEADIGTEEKSVEKPVKEAPKAVEKKPEPQKKAAPAAAAKKEDAAKAEASVRVDTSLLDDIMNLVGELVLVRNRLKTLDMNAEVTDEGMTKAIANLDMVTADLQTSVMKTRMQPIKKVFGRFPRLVRDLARSLGKEIDLKLVGEETDLDKNLVEALADPLVHLVRNSCDHGVEMPDLREERGKTRKGTITLSAEQAGDHILIYIEDDGNGMNADVLREKAIEKGLMDRESAERLTEKECYNLIFMPGFSTKAEISDISGRGVGMDVVKTKITQLNGRLEIDSTLGTGSRVTIKVPLTLAILPTLMVIVQDQRFAFPLTAVSEIFHLDLTKLNIVDGQETVIIRNKALPLFFLNHWLIKDSPKERPDSGHVVIISAGSQRMGFVVDQLVGQEEVVIKPLGVLLQSTTPGMAGATITGEGQIALILEIADLIRHYAKRVIA
ncbi:Chemotaxis protein CheA [Piscirickettsia salmonis]|uniref:Chemotaxis protein CheA n=1 Tax=Piscirickettsia salmonis TaxID=1238 RepID=A0A1L6TBI4_PISSA|nr:chemotaxis protein CheA [Piscirickettsia salmonis]AKP73886.1 chemotaxis protein CheA [Piscirickettsia salmonis LF-89 = ATCC VR-1361]ALB22696.1 chemotaxis protein CheA [Piscirickettsia salmonis]ALY02703.1 chemotaxis protein CheA [Piscirickettsia salmonis]AMA42248.1 chemotaxis protein CheA [Piscirickettsia salmonis]AOS34723.1 chemotaxis protein CheA [Piscirickettsia salmonis]